MILGRKFMLNDVLLVKDFSMKQEEWIAREGLFYSEIMQFTLLNN